ncbi:MAG TPA: WXG100 family type VII secretion target [Microbacteriaceae bacterium]|nr:WXG100 family type VII secretion target [Microbacteriaceae bacterium]
MSAFHVDAEQVQQAASTALATAGRISTDTAGLLAQLTGLQSSWGGTAAVAFQDTLNQWRATQQVVEQSLNNIQQALAAAAQHYAEVEQANMRLFSR